MGVLYLPFAMNTVLHALWVPETAPALGRFFLWGETTRYAKTRVHSVFTPPQAIQQSVENSGVRLPYLTGRYQTLPLMLPAQGNRPLLSASLNNPPPRRRVKSPAQELKVFGVNGLSLSALETARVLWQAPALASEALTFGPGWVFWQRAAVLLAEVLAQGYYLPGVDNAGYGRWEPLWLSAEHRARREALAQAMPPAALALARILPAPAELLAAFFNDLTHAFVSEAYAPGKMPLVGAPARPADVWWLNLFPRHPASMGEAPPPAPADFIPAVRRWAAPLHSYLASNWRLVLRLEPPPTADPEAAWRLSFHLQPHHQPDVLLAASEVWTAPPEPDLPAVLHGGLGHAARLYPPLQACLDEGQPEWMTLPVAAAAEFLERYAETLAQNGFGVLVPHWWQGRARSLTTRFSLTQAEGSGLFGMDALVNFDWQLAVGDQTLTAEEFAALAQSKTSLVQVRGEWVQLDPQQVQAALKLVQRHQKSQGQLTLREALSLALLDGETSEWEGLQVERVALDRWLDDLRQRLKNRQTLQIVPQPQSFNGALRPYQINGLSWLAFMRDYGFGACLADDMGLGKTIQVLALLAKDYEERKLTAPVLLVCPTTVVNNWVREAERFAPQLRCYAHHGPQRAKEDAFEAAVRDYHLVITSYALLPRDYAFMEKVRWHGVVLDEAHNIKNPSTKQAQSARRLRARFRLALTGTPVENRLQDLWSIMHFLNPGYLGSAETFQRRFAGPIERGEDPSAAPELRALTGPFILRRLKTDQSIIRDLPPKNEMKEYCGLTKEQAALYRAVVQESLRQIAEASGMQRRGIILATLTKLKQVCNHPRHLLGDNSALHGRSGKLTRLMEMLEQALAEDDRILIFTQYAEMGHILHDYLNQHVGETLYLHGGTPAAARAALIDRFQTGAAKVFVLSLKAGGAGINLTRANRVFHYDRWWNPAVENQATDRAFRIGQTQTVQVHKFICRGTLEERVDELIEQKTRLAEQIVGAGEHWLTDLTTEQLRDLLALRREALDD